MWEGFVHRGGGFCFIAVFLLVRVVTLRRCRFPPFIVFLSPIDGLFSFYFLVFIRRHPDLLCTREKEINVANVLFTCRISRNCDQFLPFWLKEFFLDSLILFLTYPEKIRLFLATDSRSWLFCCCAAIFLCLSLGLRDKAKC